MSEPSHIVQVLREELKKIDNLKAWCNEHNLPYSYANQIKNGERARLGYETVGKFCSALSIDPNTGMPLPSIKTQIELTGDQTREWLKKIDLSQLGIKPPTSAKTHKTGKGVFTDKQQPYTRNTASGESEFSPACVTKF